MATLSELAGMDSKDFNARIEMCLFEKANEVLASPKDYNTEEVSYAKLIYQGRYTLNIVRNCVLTNSTIQAMDNPYDVSDSDLRNAVKTEQFTLLAMAYA